MALVLNGSGAVTGLTTIPDGVLTDGNMPAGSILQVVSATKTDTFATNPGSTWIDVTGLSVSITPSSSSNKVLIQISISGSGQTASNLAHFRLVRGATVIYAGDTAGNRASGFAAAIDSDVNTTEHTSGIFLDSPSTTSATTYKIQTYSNGTVYINRSPNDADNVNRNRSASSIIAMEVAG